MNTSTQIQAFFDEGTHTVTYLLSDPLTKYAAVIDPVLDYDHRSGTVATSSADKVLEAVCSQKLQVLWVLETHVHADHLSAAPYIKRHTGAQVAIGAHIRDVQSAFRYTLNFLEMDEGVSKFDRLLHDGETLSIGNISIEVLHTPGHTPACVSYRVEDAVFVGDTLFMPDYGTARADFPGGSERLLYQSIRKLLKSPPKTRLFMCHDYKSAGRNEYAWETTVEEQCARNIHVHDGIDEDTFVLTRMQRDAALPAPALLWPSIQVNIRAGNLPDPEINGAQYLKTPIFHKNQSK
ncbi:MBL fold metallo-hydrolase [Comamonas thiooxydans]|uniref:MBL fold metallo-hydrolase n=1 Tax=Comamonas thiooxydans TaxID=363952 RepID=UPI000B3638BD|nr:MBL fold metallo-hydrolase [Comamonas thiooxydans]BDR08997.1 MBL fold metallo-hydrolase [Comamonas thiooxydans]